jgi:L,D-peptidoglycan transpeptidase YkuD (ErfK/YbiS/YcfS/YnhG family)
VGNEWRTVLGPTPTDLGELGVGAPADSVFRTPEGTFSLGQAFGREPNPGTRLSYFQTTGKDWWDEDVNSPTYNRHVHSVQKPSDDAENLYDSGYIYDYAVVINHNAQRIPGRQAGIFLHVTNGRPTWGCVAVGREQMRSLLQWLDPAANPKITIGVGAVGPTGQT